MLTLKTLLPLSITVFFACANTADLGGSPAADGGNPGNTGVAKTNEDAATATVAPEGCIAPTTSNYYDHKFPSGTCVPGGCAPGDFKLPASLVDYAYKCPAMDGEPFICVAPLCPSSNDGGACGPLKTYPNLVEPGGTLATRPTGTVLRISLAYQGTRVAITDVTGLTKILPPSVGPFQAGINAGYWFELRTAGDAVLDTRLIQDPTTQEAPGPDGGFTNSVRPLCDEKTFEVVVPNDPTAHYAVVFGSPYGTQLAATELARFKIP